MTRNDFKAQMVLNCLSKEGIDYSELMEMDEGTPFGLNSDGMEIVGNAIDFANQVLSYMEDCYHIELE